MKTSLEPDAPSPSRPDIDETGPWAPAVFGAVSVALSFGISELLAGAIGAPSLIQGVADWVVDSAPPGVKDWAISVFGTNDKPALLIGIVVVGLLLVALSVCFPGAGSNRLSLHSAPSGSWLRPQQHRTRPPAPPAPG